MEVFAANGGIEELRRYYEDLHRFGQRLAETAIRFQELVRSGKWPEREVSFSYDRNDPRDILNRSIDITRRFEFIVAVTGAFSSGKSTLLNVLLDAPDLLPASAIPLTAVCTVIRHGTEPAIEVRYVSLEEAFGRIRDFIDRPFLKELRKPSDLDEAYEHPENFVEDPAAQETLRRFAELLQRYDRIVARRPVFAERAPYIAGGGVVPVSGPEGVEWRYFVPTPAQREEYLAQGGDPDLWVTREWLALIRDVTLWVDSPLLENNIVFLDLPGLNCREDYHRRAIREYCNLADCVVVTAFQPGNQADEEVIENFKRLSKNYREKLFFVFNRVDQFQTEPEELVRSFDYLCRDCIGFDFPRDRCFFTSAYLAREYRKRGSAVRPELERFRLAFEGLRSTIPGFDELVERATNPEDPGGVGYLRECLEKFLKEDAYRTKIEEILANYDEVVDSLRTAASPHYQDYLRLDTRELRLRAALEAFRGLEQGLRQVLYSFGQEYLRGAGDSGPQVRNDLKAALQKIHAQIEREIDAYFSRPIPGVPPRTDPVSEFDLRRIADDATAVMRRRFQEAIVQGVADTVRQRFYGLLNRARARERLKALLGGDTEWMRRFDQLLERFEFMLRHTVFCKVREPLFNMPGGKDLKRLERSMALAKVKGFLIEVFKDFYPNWIFQNVYPAVLDGLWLGLYLDAEEFGEELKRFLESCQGQVTSPQVLERTALREEEGSDLFELAKVSREIEELVEEKEALRNRLLRRGLVAQVS